MIIQQEETSLEIGRMSYKDGPRLRIVVEDCDIHSGTIIDLTYTEAKAAIDAMQADMDRGERATIMAMKSA